MRVRIDNELCQGHARCYELCPEVFDVDDYGYGLVKSDEPVPAWEGKVLEAHRSCPEAAIIIER